jgi:hypothetical protein
VSTRARDATQQRLRTTYQHGQASIASSAMPGKGGSAFRDDRGRSRGPPGQTAAQAESGGEGFGTS